MAISKACALACFDSCACLSRQRASTYWRNWVSASLPSEGKNELFALSTREIEDGKISGNIFFPNETDTFTPEPNIIKNIWFSRDLEKMSNYLNTKPILVILSSKVNDKSIVTTPLSPNFINNHLQYAITWFSMALAWLFMSIYLIIRLVSNHKKVNLKNVI